MVLFLEPSHRQGRCGYCSFLMCLLCSFKKYCSTVIFRSGIMSLLALSITSFTLYSLLLPLGKVYFTFNPFRSLAMMPLC